VDTTNLEGRALALWEQDKEENSDIKIKSWDSLNSQHFDPVKFIINDLLPPGVSLLSGKPKQGKSWLVHAMLLMVAAGRNAFGLNVNQSSVLYMALEDSERRLKDRTRILMDSYQISDNDIDGRFYVTTEAKKLGDGLEEQLIELLSDNIVIKFVVIDVLARIRQQRKGNQSVYESDYEVGKRLKDISKTHPDVAFLIVHHNNKGDGDSIDSVSGSHGLTGGVDNALVMMNTGNGIELHINGRDIENSAPIPLSKNKDGMWTLESREKAKSVFNSETRNKVLSAVIDGIETPKDIVEETGLDSKVVEQQLYRLVKIGTLEKPQRGTYVLAKTPS